MKGFAIYDFKFGQINIGYDDDYIIHIKREREFASDLGIRTTTSDNAYNQLLEYIEGKRKNFDIKFKFNGTDFQNKVWKALCDIPYGETKSYKEVAIAIGNEKACRAVGMANNKNPIGIIVPCHRVIGSNGKLVGYAGGLDMKESLLKLEKENFMNLETERLILRGWRESDAAELYEQAKDPRVGPIAGWPSHTSVENSLDIIKNVLMKDNNFALVLKSENKVVGCIGLMIGKDSNLSIKDNEGEIGYWIGVPYWGQGLVPEATREIIRYSFDNLNLSKLWCGYFDGNIKSKRAQEKCGFLYHHTNENVPWPLMNDIRTIHVTCLAKI